MFLNQCNCLGLSSFYLLNNAIVVMDTIQDTEPLNE